MSGQKSGSYLKNEAARKEHGYGKERNSQVGSLDGFNGLYCFLDVRSRLQPRTGPSAPAASGGPGTRSPGASAPPAPNQEQPRRPSLERPGAPAPNISQVQTGMTIDQVKQIMGNPAEIKQKGAITEYKYYTPQKVEVKFQNNQVMAVEMH